ncbi:hypothetical protein SLS58_005823 [Diplodia intermedia]|uniref:Uncharacterized protein n=1 Tax=Diplodia intermedia TaxID=856260 RepID=A0ABR3TPS1_9PEZI
MYLSTILASFFALMACAIPLAHQRRPSDMACANAGDCYKLQSFNVTADKLIHLSFTIYADGNSHDNKTVCSTSWEVDANVWPQDYIKCNNDLFQWKFSKFNSVIDWTMEATHDFSLGGFGARAFANGTAVSNDFLCEADASGAQHCSLKTDHVINLALYAMIA